MIPVVLVAPSTAQDPEHRLLRAALIGLSREPVRVLAATNRKSMRRPAPRAGQRAAGRVALVLRGRCRRCALVISHAGHGTVARALASGCPVLAVPHSGDMAENAARVRLGRSRCQAAVAAAHADDAQAGRQPSAGRGLAVSPARELASWAAANDGVTRAAELVEELALSPRASRVRTR